LPGEFYLRNHKPEYCYNDIAVASSSLAQAHNFANGMTLPIPHKHEHMYVAGFVCKAYCLENTRRTQHADLAALFSLGGVEGSNVVSFYGASRHCRFQSPDSAVLENVYSGVISNLRGTDEACVFVAHTTIGWTVGKCGIPMRPTKVG